MRIWFDILTPKQVNYFPPFIRELRRQNKDNEILCTGRDYRELTELAAIKGLKDIFFVGKHGGGSLYDKLKASAMRTELLIDIVKEFEPDLLVSLCSPEASRVAFGLGIKHLGFCDSPHAEAVNRLAIPLMTKLMIPSIIPVRQYTRFGISSKNLIRYKAMDPAVWLFDDYNRQEGYTYKSLDLNPSKKTITFRFEESEAAYLSNTDKSISINMLAALRPLADDYNVIVLSRYLHQIQKVKDEFGSKVNVIEKVVDGKSLLMLSDLFIGSGGTMNWECALLGVPSISYTPMKYHINEYFIRKGMIRRCNDPARLANIAKKMLSDTRIKQTLKKKSEKQVSKMEDLKALTVKSIQSLIEEQSN